MRANPSARYRKKPVVIEAARLVVASADAVAEWCDGYVVRDGPADVDIWVNIPTLEGVMRASLGDYVIRGVQGEFYPCKPDIFTATYEPEES